MDKEKFIVLSGCINNLFGTPIIICAYSKSSTSRYLYEYYGTFMDPRLPELDTDYRKFYSVQYDEVPEDVIPILGNIESHSHFLEQFQQDFYHDIISPAITKYQTLASDFAFYKPLEMSEIGRHNIHHLNQRKPQFIGLIFKYSKCEDLKEFSKIITKFITYVDKE